MKDNLTKLAGVALAVTMLVACATPISIEQARSRAQERFRSAAQAAVGASVAVSRNGQVVWTDAIGFADEQRRRPADQATLYRVYSLIKPVTAVAALRLVEQKMLDPDAPIDRYVPEYPQPDVARKVTARMLATHESGLRHYRDTAEARGQTHCTSTAEALPIFASDPLVAEPGAGPSYSTWGFALLSHVLERAAGMPFTRVMQDQVFQPARMLSIAHDDPGAELPARAASYNRVSGQAEPSPPIDNSCKWGGGGFVASTTDLINFATALYEAKTPISRATQDAMFRGQPEYAAIGWAEGGMGYLVVDREARVAVVILTNTLDRELGEALLSARDDIAELFRRVDAQD